MSFVKVLRGGQITMPKEMREVLEIKEGDILEVQMEKDKVVLKPKILVDKSQAWEKLNQVMAKVGKRHRRIPEKEVETDVLEAIKTVRSK
ncbi:MAG: AbrB/MazE/SpoVT family DNA-binding domain-containing protein [Deltaproteobacteria bacterium]|nr:AbrB/MazE/SpoVT family DNA-binding domain-containing protein [Deltaproteobacteria bacterium]MBM4350719.1 AbrB/MazE/SpoVT family DNA-binding domain-containing protein [Deltaproteobacteria bacterium]